MSMMLNRRVSKILLAVAAAALAGSPGLAADDAPLRVSHVEGRAAYEPAGEVDWSEVTVNLPLLSGDRIVSHPDSYVEVELGFANFLRVGPSTDVSVRRTGSGDTALDLGTGDVILRVYESERYRVYTPEATVVLKKKGLYRISAQPSGETFVGVRKGEAEVENSFRNRKVRTGESIWVGSSQSALTRVSGYYDTDGFDEWSDRRDALYITDDSVRYVGHRAGAYHLDQHGYWDSVDDYGSVWFPYAASGWAPYRTGRWAHYPGYGWTWISYEPWGWLPYHYGHWVYYRPYSRWCWVPGGFGSWYGARVHFYFGSGYVGWRPWRYGYNGYGGGGGVTVVNNNTTVINNTVNNRWNIPDRRGMTVVREEDFARGRPDRVLVSNPTPAVVRDFSPGLPENLNRGTQRVRGERNTRALAPVTTAGRGSSSGPTVVVVGSERNTSAPTAAPARGSWSLPGRADSPVRTPAGDRRTTGATSPAPSRQNLAPERERGTSGWSLPERSPATRPQQPERTRTTTTRPSRPPAVRPGSERPSPQVRPAQPPRDTRRVVPSRSGQVRREPARSNTRVTPSRPPASSVRKQTPDRRTRVTRPSTSRPRVSPRRSTSSPRVAPRRSTSSPRVAPRRSSPPPRRSSPPPKRSTSRSKPPGV